MRSAGLILTTVLLAVASVAWWRDFSPSDSLEWHSGTKGQAPSVSSLPDTLGDSSGRSDIAALENSALSGAVESALGPAPRRAEPGRGSAPVATSSMLDSRVVDSPSTPTSSDLPTEAVATLSLTNSAGQTTPPTNEPLPHLRSPVLGTGSAVTGIPEPVAIQQTFDVPRIAAELVSERRAATVYFALDEADLLPDATATLLELARDLRDADTVMRIQVDGHCDDTGTDDYNQALSERRASAVLGFLNRQGLVAPDQVTRGFGERVWAVPGADEASRALNRRAHVRIDWVDRKSLGVTQARTHSP